MTNEDVIKTLHDIECEYGILGSDLGNEEEAIGIAIGAIKKQIPKKPKSKYYSGIFVCPACETETSRRVLFGWENCCPDCGQYIDWKI